MDYSFKYFINPAIEYGLQSYINVINGNSYNKSHIFEMSVINILVEMFGEKAILLPYKIDNQVAFKNNLLMYDYDENCLNIFINNLNNYYMYIKDYKIQKKHTNTMIYVELALLDMIKKKSAKKNIDKKLISLVDDFLINNANLNKLRSLISTDREQQVVSKWKELRNELLTKEKESSSTVLLDKKEYAKYGININSVELLNSEDIEKINDAIKNEETRTVVPVKLKDKIALTSGNGFVDVLIILSIILTQIMIGSIILAIVVGG